MVLLKALFEKWSLLGRAKQIGLGVGGALVAIVVLGAAACALYWWWTRRSRRRNHVRFEVADKAAQQVEAPPPPPCKPEGRFQIPFYSGMAAAAAGEATRTSPAEVRVKADFAKTCGATKIAWQFASGLKAQPSATSDFEEFATMNAAQPRTHDRNVKNPGLLKGSGWVRLIASYASGSDELLAPPFQLPPLFTLACYNLAFQ